MYAGTVIPPDNIIAISEINHSGLFSETKRHLSPSFIFSLITFDKFKIFLVASIFSVLGGIFGYLIGYLFFDLAMHVIEFYNYEDKVKDLKLNMSKGNGFLAWLSILFLAGFTPLPYKAFTIASGLIAFNLPVFIIVSLISRSLRFFIVAFLSYKFGELFTEYMNNHGSKWFTVIGIILVIIFIFVYLVLKFNG